MKYFIILLCFFCLASTVSANNSVSLNNMINLSDQSRCESEANYMAQNRIRGHVWNTIGNFEGVGFGSNPNPNTCVPKNNMRLTGDATARDSSGNYYRVRSWRY